MEPPTRDPSDSLIAYGAESGLFMPEEPKNANTPKCFRQMISFAFLEVSFIGRIIRVCFALDFDVSFNGCATGGQQPHLIRCPLVVTCFPEEVPVTLPIPFKVFRFEPVRGFVRVPSSCPPPQTIEDDIIHVVKSTLAYHVSMIIGPTPYPRVEFLNQIGGRHSKRGFDRPSDSIQEGLDVFLGWLDEQLPIGVSAHVLSEEIEAIRHLRDKRLRRREFKPSFIEKLLHERFDSSLQ